MSNLDIEEQKIDCLMCQHWSMFQCHVDSSKFPHEGHLCTQFEITPEAQDELQFENLK